MDRVITILASAIVDVVAFRRVWNRIKPIPRSTTDKCSEHNPKIGPLTDLHTRWYSSYFSSKRSSYKKERKCTRTSFYWKIFFFTNILIFSFVPLNHYGHRFSNCQPSTLLKAIANARNNTQHCCAQQCCLLSRDASRCVQTLLTSRNRLGL